jgi:hypothetical protein
LLFSGIGCVSPQEISTVKMAGLLPRHVVQKHKLVNGPMGRHID